MLASVEEDFHLEWTKKRGAAHDTERLVWRTPQVKRSMVEINGSWRIGGHGPAPLAS